MGLNYDSSLMVAITRALSEMVSDNPKNGDPIARWMRMLLPDYQQYMYDFNSHSVKYCETDFRLSDSRVAEMQREANLVGGLNHAINKPLIFVIRYDSLYKYFRVLPSRFEPPLNVGSQINAESLISAELQRVLSAFLVMMDRIEIDGRAGGFTNKAVLQMAIHSTESNHFPRSIFELCLRDGNTARMSVQQITLLRDNFDEFEAVFFRRFAQIVDAHPEMFVFTFRVFRRYIKVPILSEEEYRALRRTGIIFDTGRSPAQEGQRHEMTWLELGIALRSFRLIAHMRSRDAVVTLPEI